jgi:hypothetical protein
MAFSPKPVLVFDRDEDRNKLRYPCGGFVFVPDENGAEGMQVSPVLNSNCAAAYFAIFK